MSNSWDIVVVNKTNEGYLVMAPNGDTQWLTHEAYQIMIEKRKSLYIHEDKR